MGKAETKALIKVFGGKEPVSRARIVQHNTGPKDITKKAPTNKATVGQIAGPKIEAIIEAAQKEQEAAAMKRKKFAVGAKNNLMSRLGMNPGKAHDFIGQFGPALACYLVDWFERIPEDVRYRDIMAVVRQAIEEDRFSLVSVRFSTPPIVESCEHSLRAIEFITESFAPRENRVLAEGGAKAKAEA